MAKLIAIEEISLNGNVENPHTWPPHHSPDYFADLGATFAGEGRLLFGRATFELMESAWRGQDNPIGQFMDRAQKYVVSSTLKNPDWSNTTVLSGDALEQIRELKAGSGPDMVLLGSLTLLQSLLAAELIDELQFNIHPLLRSEGRFFPQTDDLEAFRLQSHKAYQGGMARVSLSLGGKAASPKQP